MRKRAAGYARDMSDFFDVPAPPEHPDHSMARYKQPDWAGAPDNYLPALVPIEVTIGRSENAVVHISAIRAYPAGWSFSLDMMTESSSDSPWDDPSEMMMHRHHMMGMHAKQEALPDELMRFGFEFPDGTKVTSVGFGFGSHDADGRPSSPVLMQGGGGGGGGNWQSDYWCWPIPTEGMLKIVCEWPAKGIKETITEIDTGAIREASGRSEKLWADAPDPPEGSGEGVSVNVW